MVLIFSRQTGLQDSMQCSEIKQNCPKKDLFAQLTHYDFLFVTSYSKIYKNKLHYLSPFSTLWVSRVSNFQIPNMIQRLYIQAPNRYTHSYMQHTLNWVYGFTEGLKIGRVGSRDISVRGKAGEPQGKNIPWKLSRWGQFFKPRGSWGYSGRRGELFPLPI